MFYPPAVFHAPEAKTYGPLPDHGQTAVALVLHTTETPNHVVPRYGGDPAPRAPHLTYDPLARQWFHHGAGVDRYVGTLTGHTDAGHGNCKAVSVEVICYSDRNTVDDDPDRRTWVGDLSDDAYRDLGDLVAWLRSEGVIGDGVTPTPAGGWRYGVNSPHRATEPEWRAFTGLSGHGWVFGNRHWDPGVLDLGRVHQLSHEDTEDDMAGFFAELGDEGTFVNYWRRVARKTDRVPGIDKTGPYDDLFAHQLAEVLDLDEPLDRIGPNAAANLQRAMVPYPPPAT